VLPTLPPVAAGVTATAALSATGEVTAGAPATAAGALSASAEVSGAAAEASNGMTATGDSDIAVAVPLVSPPECTVETSAELAGYADLARRMGCPVAESSIEPVAINEFGDGPAYSRFMLWFGNEAQIYVLQPDGTWLAYTDDWSDQEPEILCNPDNLDPATSPPLPRRGFGKLWCNVESVREAMGPIDREERLCQHAVVQRFEEGRLLACFEDATIRYFRLLSEGTWDMEMVQ
jgi:hypothetical protein